MGIYKFYNSNHLRKQRSVWVNFTNRILRHQQFSQTRLLHCRSLHHGVYSTVGLTIRQNGRVSLITSKNRLAFFIFSLEHLFSSHSKITFCEKFMDFFLLAPTSICEMCTYLANIYACMGIFCESIHTIFLKIYLYNE